jgi:hypothetical protein
MVLRPGLGKLGDPRAIDPLVALLSDSSSYFLWASVEALKKLTGQDFGNNPAKWQAWWEQNKRKVPSP